MNSIGAFAAPSTPFHSREQMRGASANIKSRLQKFNMGKTQQCVGSFEVTALISWNSLSKDDVRNSDPAEEEFAQQKAAFLQQSGREPLFLAPYGGQFIASHNGQIVDSDNDLDVLTNRFFRIYGNVPVFITKIGDELPDQLNTPFED